MPSRTPSPMQVTEPVKPRTVLPKLPKPRAKDPNKREMNMEENQKLGLGLQSMPPEKMPQLLRIIRKRNDQLAQEGDEIELDIEALDTETLWELDRFVANWKKFVSKTKRQALMVNSASAVAAPSVSADIDDVPMSEKIDGVKKNKKEAGEEDVDIGDEMPESSFPHVEIEKDDGGGGQGQAATGGGQGNNDNNASSSSSSSGSSSSSAWQDQEHVPNAVGWELNKGKRVPRRINLSTTMDPIRMAISAADLNLKLMRWRALPSLDLSMLSSTKCLLLGAGTLGCQVARMLMAWGVRKITLVDSGKVAMSNPLRQSLYTLEDCLDGGDLKALAAVKSLKRIFPAVEAEGVVMAIPMPGHPVPSQEEQNVLDDCRRLHDLVDSHDAVFLLTDTRESRWLPTLLCANANKLTVTAALGFDSFLVMRHGAGPLTATDESKTESVSSLSASVEEMSLTQSDSKLRLGCYFCNDVVAPIDSTANRTLDQQCTVTRPGLAPIASALAVELLVGILHHPLGISAKAEFGNSLDSGSDEQPLGILPHQIRGALSQFSQMILVGHSSNSCTACCPTVVSEYRKRGLDFVLQAINHPTYLEDLTGLTELMKSANSFELDWDNETDNDDEDCVEI